MKLIAFDFTHAPEEILNSLLYEREDVRRVSRALLSSTRSRYVLLLTCNRVEVYTSDESEITHTLLSSALNLKYFAVRPYRYEMRDDEVIHHLYMLSTGVKSAYFGEEVILSQLNIAIETARSIGSVSSELNVLFQSAITFSKKIHTQMKVRVFDHDIVKRTIELVDGRKTLVLGSGELARSIAQALSEVGVETYQAIRDIFKADFLVPHSVKAVSWPDRYSILPSFDVIISASSSIGYTLREDALPLVKGKLLLDLAEPYDFPPSFNSLKLKDLGSSTPLKDAVVRRIDESARGEVEVFLSEMEKRKGYKEIEDRAVDIASDSVRRLNSTLDLDKETGLAEKVYETIRKASINAMMRTRKY